MRKKNKKISKVFFSKKNLNIKVNSRLINLKKQINNFINGKSKILKLKKTLKGTLKQKKVWFEISKIPYGKTSTYKLISKKLKLNPHEVGRICGENKFIIHIPCHRVIRTDGSLGGYAAPKGPKIKEKLPKLEQRV